MKSARVGNTHYTDEGSHLVGVFSRLKRQRTRFPARLVSSPDPTHGDRIFFVSHEATLTGAPKIILNILRQFCEKTNITPHAILHNGGHLCDEFEQLAQTDCLNMARKSSDDLTRKVRKICNRHRANPACVAICNSMESRYIAFELKKLGIPIIFLVHELPSSYCEEDYRSVYDCADQLIFPVHAVRDAINQTLPIPTNRSHVLAQGLLNPDFGKGIARDQARLSLRHELGIPADSFVVLGCGTLDLRKGIDHFASVARIMSSRNIDFGPVHFVWVGDGPQWVHSTYHYVMLDVQKSCADGHVHFLGERENVEPYFMGADTFLMTSRVDPFPCVVHEAMASELPVVAFENSGGASEAISDGAGIGVPFGDCESMADMICLLATQPAIADGIRKRSKEKVETIYQFENYASRVIQLAERVSGRRLMQSYSNPSFSRNDLPNDSLRRAA